MPKAKPKAENIHLFRLELQQTERDTLEAALAGRFVTNAIGATGSVLTGLGNALMPFQGALQVFAAAWIAEKGVTGALDLAKDIGESMKENTEEEMAAKGAENMLAMTAWLTATYDNGGWDAICDSTFKNYTLPKNTALFYTPYLGLESPKWFIMKCSDFLKSICSDRELHERFGVTPLELWNQHFDTQQYGSEAYYYAQQDAQKAGLGWAWLFPKSR